ncbi:MAG TPA: hypothetical protein PKJ07_05355 [Bacteroidales bacterium]|jgi:hypothetical protein|nr:hypothetical protein [Bacteroidales bacterium]HPZ36542.1 hypothetical protein [Bacteroidales bacterium]HQD34787.1 hypothetical protein [Bacteroidales bacterium]
METAIQIITGVLETGIISFIVYMIIRGLKTEIKTLHSVVINQNKTIKTMDKRIQETEKIGNLYKQLVSDFPQALEDYQTVITKTKNTTILELKSKIKEQELTIDDLTKRAQSSDPKVVQKAAGISKLFLNKENKDLLEFLQKIEEKPEIIVDAMISSNDFDDLMKILKRKIETLSQVDTREMFDAEYIKKYNIKTASFGSNGIFYMISFDNIIYITEDCLMKFKEKYNLLK